jgi:hypothetical protein
MFTITTEQINLVISNMSTLITDVMPLVLVIIGIALGVGILEGLFFNLRDSQDHRHIGRFYDDDDDF